MDGAKMLVHLVRRPDKSELVERNVYTIAELKIIMKMLMGGTFVI